MPTDTDKPFDAASIFEVAITEARDKRAQDWRQILTVWRDMRAAGATWDEAVGMMAALSASARKD